MSKEDALIDRFVAKINASERERLTDADVPPRLRVEDGDGEDGREWRIIPSDESARIEALEARLPGRLPRSFRSLVTRYAFLAFDVAPIRLFSNTGDALFHEFADRVFLDKGLSLALHPQGYIQFGNPDTGDYDPVCFDTKRRNGHGDCPIVRVEHENALQFGRVVVTETIAPSFSEFIADFLSKP